MKALFDQIEASSKINDLDQAIRPIQDILGQTDGFNASMFFSGDRGDNWAETARSLRKFHLIRYAVYELGMLELAL